MFLSATLPPVPEQPSRVYKAARKQLHALWGSKPHLVQEYIAQLLAGEESLPSLFLLSILADYSYQTGQLDISQQVSQWEEGQERGGAKLTNFVGMLAKF